MFFSCSVIGGDGFRMSSIVAADGEHQQCPHRYFQGVEPDAETKKDAKASAPAGAHCQHDIVLPMWRQNAFTGVSEMEDRCRERGSRSLGLGSHEVEGSS
jgi:hypothetical protein